ncbi:UDP-N-acetylmuramate dehydrogenase [Patescibacteria group bacterium]|nr:UDP-N-acetylmuramate dehydrogenase [Patescibacteria group bacterium]
MELKKLLPRVKKSVLLKNYTTFKIGGKAKYFFVAKNRKEIIQAVSTVKENNLPFFILGGGSNVLVADKGYRGLIIKIKNQNLKFKKNTIFAEAGVPLSKLIKVALENSLSGFEWAAGIPGTVGGTICGNSGAFGKSISDIVKEVEVFDLEKGKIKILKNKDCQFNYRDSTFKRNKNLIILSAEFKLRTRIKKEIKKKIKEYLDYRKRTQPLDLPSAGSIFKNPRFRQGSGGRAKRIPAGELIEKCGLKGKKIGNAKISKKHANFILNLGKAKAKEIKKLIDLAKKKVKNKFKINLEEEICYLGP